MAVGAEHVLCTADSCARIPRDTGLGRVTLRLPRTRGLLTLRLPRTELLLAALHRPVCGVRVLLSGLHAQECYCWVRL